MQTLLASIRNDKKLMPLLGNLFGGFKHYEELHKMCDMLTFVVN